ncbi:MAG: peptide transporter, partial [Candidatus Pacebacteria bacterium]|nr:peptide transporter [Candidatus Paceibacterota bacterium]
EQYRTLMEPPEKFHDGFNWKTVIGAFFLGFIMMPGTMYLTLVVGIGGSMSQAARWMTIVLFAEIARRSLKDLKMQEIYILYFMAGLMVGAPNQFQGLLWYQFLVRSEFSQAMGIAQEIPKWVAPSAEQIEENGRTFFTMSWLPPILFTSFALLISKVDHYGLGYVLYRLTSDVEKLPFPMAPVAASGITALANTKDRSQSWRWRCFSIGGVIGMTFGAVYIGIPAATGAILAKPIQLIPIPWVDLTPALGTYLKAAPLNLSFDIGLIFLGMVIPFWAVIGGVLGVICTMVANPLLYNAGILSNWQPQMNVIDTLFINKIDFYLSFEVGLTVAIALISLGKVFKAFFDVVTQRRGGRHGASAAGNCWHAHQGWMEAARNQQH